MMSCQRHRHLHLCPRHHHLQHLLHLLHHHHPLPLFQAPVLSHMCMVRQSSRGGTSKYRSRVSEGTLPARWNRSHLRQGKRPRRHQLLPLLTVSTTCSDFPSQRCHWLHGTSMKCMQWERALRESPRRDRMVYRCSPPMTLEVLHQVHHRHRLHRHHHRPLHEDFAWLPTA